MNDTSVRQELSLDSLVAQVVDEFRERQKQGDNPDVEEYAARYPQAADLLRKVLASWRLIGLSAAGGFHQPGAAPDDPTVGILGDLRIMREVGRGGMGVVYEAEQVSLGRRVALKVLPLVSTMDSRQLQRFQNEARAAAGLHHTNIVPVHFVGCERGVHYYAMQFIEGRDLASVIAQLREQENRKVPNSRHIQTVDAVDGEATASAAPAAIDTRLIVGLSTERSTKSLEYFRSVAQLGIQAAEALDYAHQMGIVHRDIKPANLLVDTTGRLWVTDFGLAQIQSDTRMTLTGDLVGTLRYMSPEQALAKRVVLDHRTDIYSLGATLYELLTLRPVFAGDDRQELLRQIAFDEPIRPRRLYRAIPTELETIVLKTLEKNPQDRYATAQELADDLRRFLEHRPIQARRPTLWQRVSKWTRRHQAAVLTAAIVSFAAALALAASTAVIWKAKDDKEAALGQSQINFTRAESEHHAALNAATKEAEQRRRADSSFRQGLEEITALLEILNDPNKPNRDLLRDAHPDRTIKFLQVMLAENRNDPDGRLLTSQAYLAVAEALRSRNLAQAGDAYAEGLAILQHLSAEFPGDDHYRKRVGQAQDRLRDAIGHHTNWAQNVLADGKFGEAAQAYDTDYAICTKCAVYLDPAYTRTPLIEIGLWRMRLILKLSGQLSEADESCAVVLDRAASMMAEKAKNKRTWDAMWLAKQADALTLRGLCRARAWAA